MGVLRRKPCDTTCHDIQVITVADERGTRRGSSGVGRQKLLLYVYTALAIVMMAAIFWFSAQVGADSSSKSDAIAAVICEKLIPGFSSLAADAQDGVFSAVTFAVRKTAHMTEYAILGALYCLGIYQLGIVRGICIRELSRTGLVAWVLAVAYASSDEAHQLFVDGRSGMVSDVVIDSIGAVVGIFLVLVVLKRKERKRGCASSGS